MLELCALHLSYWLTDGNRLIAEAGNVRGIAEWWVAEIKRRGQAMSYWMSVGDRAFSGVADIVTDDDVVGVKFAEPSGAEHTVWL